MLLFSAENGYRTGHLYGKPHSIPFTATYPLSFPLAGNPQCNRRSGTQTSPGPMDTRADGLAVTQYNNDVISFLLILYGPAIVAPGFI
ncbi:hypothetical protein SAMN04487894_105298 [Niabella drilacis]|uniref:Uncharacterized protein n=1 Tax=Niabella drilacis (strain DSM 25811 / CCM 8410 / CCUG 62505 / LMG 26954 / E90) TaxID=1285928 RepID=A0A1G6RJC1_NIADE|nr:hypothetical protein SAMN04487894_105298 [Niabella drilacis]